MVDGMAAVEAVAGLGHVRQAGNIHLFAVGPDRVVRCDDNLRALFGVPPGVLFDRKSWLGRIHPDDRKRSEAEFVRLVREGGSTEIEYRILLPDGGLRWLLSRAQLIQDPEPLGMILGVTMDITGYRETAERLGESQRAQAESEARLELFIRHAPAAIAMFDRNMRYLAVSQRFLEDYGLALQWSPETLVGQSHYDLFPWLPERWRQAHRRALAGETLSSQDDPFCRSDGSEGWSRWEVTPWRQTDGSIGGLLLFSEIVTDRVKAERALAESNERLRLALDAGRMGSWIWDVSTGRLTWDARQFALYGIDPAQGEPTLADILMLVHPEDRPGLEATMEAALTREQGILQCEYRVLPVGGGMRWISAYGRAMPEPDGRIARMIGLNFDVTERREAEAVLAASIEEARQAAARVQLALDAGAIAGTWIWEVASDRVTGDELFARSFGLDPQACRTGLHLQDVLESLHPQDRPRVMDTITKALAQAGPYRCEYRVRQPNGAYRWIEASGRVDPRPDGEPRSLQGVLIDIGRRRATEAERDRAAALLRSFTEAVPGVVYAADREGRILLANEGTAAVIGRPLESFLGKAITEVLGDPRQAAVVAANDLRVMETGLPEQVEEEVGFRDGAPVLWLSTKAPLRNAEGEVIGLVATSLDITERKKDEALLASSKTELERLVEERTRDLQETQARLAHAQRMEALGQLAGGIAHDFNNVLQAIQGGAARIERRAANPEAVRHVARMVADAAGRGVSITRRLLTFSRRGELRAEPLEPAPLLASMQEILSVTLGAGIVVRVEAKADLPPLLADRGQLETVLINLATNARDAMGGTGKLVLTAAAEEYLQEGGPGHPLALKVGSYIRLSVSDTGYGMDAKTLARAPEPFFTTKEPGKGTGLGLAMAQGFAEQSGGGLHIESRIGRGTTVTLWFPVADAALTPTGEAEEAACPAGVERARILLVDDEGHVREVLFQYLDEHGYEVVQAQGGAAALALMDAGESVDLIVSDLSMPEMNGVALIREAQRRRPDLPAILLTGYAGDIADLAGGAAGGRFSLLHKPVTGVELARCVASLLRKAPPVG